MHVFVTFFALFAIAYAKLKHHNENFTPDIVLVATMEPLSIDCAQRDSVLINGTSPGPTLHLYEDRTTWIRVYNNMADGNLTMHWHGLSERTAPFSDGTPHVAQWPIPGGYFFDYEVRPQRGDSGTYFYHSHVGFQQVSAYGPLIVKSRWEWPPYYYSDDIVLTVGNYFAQNDSTVISELLGSPFVWTGEARAVTVNGQSGTRAFDNCSDSCAPHVIDVEPGLEYRLRVIGASALTTVKMVIEDHANLTVIEADGEYTQPAAIDHIQVAPGQRFSYLFRSKSLEELQSLNKTEFWIRYESRDRPTVTSGYALLRYTCDGMVTDLSTLALPEDSLIKVPEQTNDYLEYALTPLSDSAVDEFPRLEEVTRTVVLTMQQVSTAGIFSNGSLEGKIMWVGNGENWGDPAPRTYYHIPYLVNMYENNVSPDYDYAVAHSGFDNSSATYPARIGEVLDIVWVNDAGITGSYDTHPMHMHGQHYWDLGSGNGTYDAAANEKRFASHTPMRRDTTVLYRYGTKGVPFTKAGWRAWRVRVTERNIGAWMAHCHIAQHAIMGMNTVWIFGEAEDLRRKFPDLPFVKGYLTYGGSAYGNATQDPWVNHWFGDGDGGDDGDQGDGKENALARFLHWVTGS